jgi:preprotein translocase subunit SecG
MNVVLTILVVIASIILILVVLVQKSKGGGLSSSFASSNAVMGVRKTTDFIEKATWGLASFIIVISIVCVVVQPKRTMVSSKPQVTTPVNETPANVTPDFGTGAPVVPNTTPQTPAPADNQENN